MESHIILTGFMCSGKTTYGKILASALRMPFVDLDEYIAEESGKSISVLFKEHGEDAFRQIEKHCLHNVLNMQSQVIAVGGGTPCFYDNMAQMNSKGITVYLQAGVQTLFDWIKESCIERPLLAGKTDSELFEYITELLNKRKMFYEQAAITISAHDFSVDELAEKIALLNND